MERMVERSCGLDVHKKTVTACVRAPGAGGGQGQEVRTFGTTTAELLLLRDWLEAHAVTAVAMESTGVYWKPVFYVLEDRFRCVLANAGQIAQVPGRKTDVQDCIWIAQLLEHGLPRSEAGVLCVGGPLPLRARERRADRPGARPQDGCTGLYLDCPIAGTRASKIGSRCSMCWRTASAACSRTPGRSPRCQAARRMYRTVSGLPNCWNTGF